MKANVQRFLEDLNKIELIDIHSHIDAAHPCARGLDDILLYHMVITELYSAGCPDGERMPDGIDCAYDEDYALRRLERAIPYVKYIRGTALYWLVRTILADLYDWHEELNEENWRRCHELIKSRNTGYARAKEIARKANIIKTSTELWRGREHKHDDMFFYSLEWAFFTRSQWGMNNAPLFELEHAWNEEVPGPPVPVTANSVYDFKRKIRTIEDVDAAINHYIDRIPYGEVTSTATHFSTDIRYFDVTRADMIEALKNRDHPSEHDRDVYANYINEEFLRGVERKTAAIGKPIAIQYSLGAEPLPFETGSKMRVETIFELSRIFARHPALRFEISLASASADQAWCTLARELPNLHLNGFWWHNFFPVHIKQVINDRLDMLPTNKQGGFFTDAYCMDWAYGKAKLIKQMYAEVFAEKIEAGQYDYDTALEVARQVLYVDSVPHVYEK
ncbi:MAG: hypothetical protein KIG36_07760 [Eubacteriales bacterium]|nr:hypothetical protein [Eubacteriales bacterium]